MEDTLEPIHRLIQDTLEEIRATKTNGKRKRRFDRISVEQIQLKTAQERERKKLAVSEAEKQKLLKITEAEKKTIRRENL